jgi:hypothetical protein
MAEETQVDQGKHGETNIHEVRTPQTMTYAVGDNYQVIVTTVCGPLVDKQ